MADQELLLCTQLVYYVFAKYNLDKGLFDSHVQPHIYDGLLHGQISKHVAFTIAQAMADGFFSPYHG